MNISGEVLDLAGKKLAGMGIHTICLDKLPASSEEITRKGIDKVVDEIVLDTIYWERG